MNMTIMGGTSTRLVRISQVSMLVLLTVLLLPITGRSQGSAYNLLAFGTPVYSANPVLEAMGGGFTWGSALIRW